jgi:hypothetical protein
MGSIASSISKPLDTEEVAAPTGVQAMVKKTFPWTAQDEPEPDSPLKQQLIADRAYEIWEASGHPEGTDVEDWLNAERQIEAGEPPDAARHL